MILGIIIQISSFCVLKAFSTKMSVEREMTLPITPRVIALGK